MTKIEEFVKLITGRFDNKEQFDAMKKAGKTYPYAQHVNTVCNDKIKNLPADFKGMFIVEESYYENEGKRHASPHLFLITEKEDRILLSSYEIPNGEDKNTFSYEFMKEVEYIELKKSKKFTPALYYERNGVWEGGSTSQFVIIQIFHMHIYCTDLMIFISIIIIDTFNNITTKCIQCDFIFSISHFATSTLLIHRSKNVKELTNTFFLRFT